MEHAWEVNHLSTRRNNRIGLGPEFLLETGQCQGAWLLAINQCEEFAEGREANDERYIQRISDALQGAQTWILVVWILKERNSCLGHSDFFSQFVLTPAPLFASGTNLSSRCPSNRSGKDIAISSPKELPESPRSHVLLPLPRQLTPSVFAESRRQYPTSEFSLFQWRPQEAKSDGRAHNILTGDTELC